MSEERNLEIKANFTQLWMNFAAEHEEDLTAGDWSHLFAVLIGTSLALGAVEKEKVPSLIVSVGEVVQQVFSSACEYLDIETPMQ